ncbi:MAG: aminotransferase class V-fold PLP-dependent enzyme [Mariprofundaceae bacterium]|nr:aminotransferase class V-fold PLP-dependent enzyme [Mariprofundaceae bacterium]
MLKDEFSDEFPLRDGLIYLNHAAVGVWPQRTAAAVKQFADENMHQGAADYPRWMQAERRLRIQFCKLLGTGSADDIALVKNTSEGLSLLAYGLDWQAGDTIVSTDQEFPSNRIVWESLQHQGVELRLADISGDDPEAAILALCDAKTRLLTVSSVQYASGLRLNLQYLGAFCREHGIIFCVDAIQSLGALCFDAEACHADVVTADGHKWMLGPEGLAVFYIRPQLRQRLKLHQFGWHMLEQAGDFERRDWQAANSARCFEPGSPNMLGIHALSASLSLFEDVGMDVVQAELMQRVRFLLDAVHSESVQGESKLLLLSPSQTSRLSGIVSFRRCDLDDAGHAALYRHLMASSVVCALRGGGIRFSPHFYTPMPQLETAMTMVTSFKPGD